MRQVMAVVAPIAIFLLSCQQGSFYSSEVEIPGGVWKSTEAALFTPNFDDTLQSYHILLSISNSKQYRYSNIWLFVKSKSPDGFSQKDTLEVFLADETGKWFGKKQGEQWNYKFYYKKNIRFPKTGKYTFEIQQGMRENEIQGISSISFELEKNKD